MGSMGSRRQKAIKIGKGKPPLCDKCKGTGLSGKCACGKPTGTQHPVEFITVINDLTGKEERRVRRRCSGKSTTCGKCAGLGFLLVRK